MTGFEVVEVFIPSGTEASEVSQGLFTGDHDAIKLLVAHTTWLKGNADQVHLRPREIKHISREVYESYRNAQLRVQAAESELKKLREELNL